MRFKVMTTFCDSYQLAFKLHIVICCLYCWRFVSTHSPTRCITTSWSALCIESSPRNGFHLGKLSVISYEVEVVHGLKQMNHSVRECFVVLSSTLTIFSKLRPQIELLYNKSSDLRAMFIETLNRVTQGYTMHTPLKMIPSITLKEKVSLGPVF